MNASDLKEKTRVILFHKQPISALTQFVLYPSGSILAPEALPKLASPLDEDCDMEKGDIKVTSHPASIVQQICEPLQIPLDLLRVENGYRSLVEVPDGIVTVYLARIDTIDPPHDLVDLLGYRLLPLTGLRGQPSVEMELLRRAYVCAMET